jgi:hypothetical protein
LTPESLRVLTPGWATISTSHTNTHTPLLVACFPPPEPPPLSPSPVNTNGNIVSDEEMGEVIQLQGDQRQKVKEWLLDQQIVPAHEAADRIVIHGF